MKPVTTTGFRIYDPRRGAKYPLRFGRKDTVRVEDHEWVLVTGNAPPDNQGALLGSLARSTMKNYGRDSLVVQVGPPVYRMSQVKMYPKSWCLLQERPRALTFFVSRPDFEEFDHYFANASLYEPWTLFFWPSASELEARDIEPQVFGPSVLLEPHRPWSELLWLDGDSGTLLCLVTICRQTDEFIGELVSTGVAEYG